MRCICLIGYLFTIRVVDKIFRYHPQSEAERVATTEVRIVVGFEDAAPEGAAPVFPLPDEQSVRVMLEEDGQLCSAELSPGF